MVKKLLLSQVAIGDCYLNITSHLNILIVLMLALLPQSTDSRVQSSSTAMKSFRSSTSSAEFRVLFSITWKLRSPLLSTYSKGIVNIAIKSAIKVILNVHQSVGVQFEKGMLIASDGTYFSENIFLE